MTHSPNSVSVDCLFEPNGRVRVQRIKFTDGQWQRVEQGRQWLDKAGRHTLIMLHGRTHQLTLKIETLQWELRPVNSGPVAV